MPDISPIPVVCALIERAGSVLIAQRPVHKHLGLEWEFPGGKVEAGETPEAALRREITEELGCTLGSLRYIGTAHHDYGSVRIQLTAFAGPLTEDSPDPSPREHLAVRWLTHDELRAARLAPADLPVLRDYLAQQVTS